MKNIALRNKIDKINSNKIIKENNKDEEEDNNNIDENEEDKKNMHKSKRKIK
jgi:hypothetical protein